MQISAFSYLTMAFKRDICVSKHYLICSDAVAQNSNDRKLLGTDMYSTNFAADIYLPCENGSWAFFATKTEAFPSENNRHSFYLYYKNSR